MTDPTTISKHLHVEVMGKKWHETVTRVDTGGINLWTCKMCNDEKNWYLHPWYGWDGITKIVCKENPDYLNNKSDSRDFLNFCVNEWDGWEEFLGWRWGESDKPIKKPTRFTARALRCLLKDLPILPTAVYTYCKERENG